MDVLPLLERLVSIDSVNPGLGGRRRGGDRDVRRRVARGAGLEVEFDEAAPGRPNVIVDRARVGRRGTLLLNAHLDTVGYAGMADPLSRGSRTAGCTAAARTT